MRYFSYISFEYTPKNKLHEQVHEFLKANDRKIIEADKVDQFKRHILSGIKKLNQANPKCNPIEAHWWNPALIGKKDHLLNVGIGTICSFNLFHEESKN